MQFIYTKTNMTMLYLFIYSKNKGEANVDLWAVDEWRISLHHQTVDNLLLLVCYKIATQWMNMRCLVYFTIQIELNKADVYM